MFFLPRIRAWVSVAYEHTPPIWHPILAHTTQRVTISGVVQQIPCVVFSGIVFFGLIECTFFLVSVMYFDNLLFVFLYAFLVRCESVARRVKVYRLPSGIDKFEVLDDNMNSICTEIKRAKEFCANHGAINVQNTGSCSNHEETLQCRCNSTKSTFLLHEGRCVNNHNITRLLHGGISSGRRCA